MIIMATLP